MSRGHSLQNRTITLFSPEGRLFQVEYAFKGVTACGMTALALRGADSFAFCVQKKVPDKLIMPHSVTSIFKITPKIGCVITGKIVDGKAMVVRMRQVAGDFKNDNGYEMPVHLLAQRVGEINQQCTQQASRRPYCVMVILGAIDDEIGPQLFKIDPAGLVQGFKGVASGTKEQEAMTILEKHYKKKEGKFTKKELTETVIDSLQTVIGGDFKATDIEVGFATTEEPQFDKLPEDEIENYLNIIADKY